MSLREIKKAAEDVSRVVGKRMRDAHASSDQFQIMHKGPTDLVTEIDIWSEQQILALVEKKFPDHIVIGEETAPELQVKTGKSLEELSKKGVCWIVDPIDGTTNFANRIPHSAVSIAILEDGVRKVGVIYDPFRDEMFAAERGHGATLNGKKIKVNTKPDLLGSVIATGWPHDRLNNWGRYKWVYEAFLTKSRDLRRFGAATLDQCWVACGRFDAYFEYTLKSWDVAAGSLIVEEAGGRATNLKGSEPFSVFSDFFLFSAESIYDQMVEVATLAEKHRKES